MKKARKACARTASEHCGKNERPFAQRSLEGMFFLAFVLLLLSALVGMNFKPQVRLFVAGEIATQDIMATQDLLVEEKASTQAKREEVARAQPVIFDLSLEAIDALETRVGRIFGILNQASLDQLEQIRWQIAEILNTEVWPDTLAVLRNNEIQNLVIIRIAPWLAAKFAQGVTLDARTVQRFERGVLVRDLSSGVETLRVDVHKLMDVSRLRGELDEFLRNELKKSLRIRKAVLNLLSPLILPSLTYNADATQERVREVTAAVEPVYYHIKKGEVIVRTGERVDPQSQLKLQALFNQEPEHFEARKALGVFLVGLLFVVSMTLTPKGALLQPLNNRDALLVATIILLCVSPLRFLVEIDAPVAQRLPFFSGDMFPFSYPLAGAAGLLALFLSPVVCLFATLLLIFFACQIIGGGVDIFVFFFLAAVMNMTLIKRTQNRIDVLKSVMPLLMWQLLVWLGVVLMRAKAPAGLGVESMLVVANAGASLLIVLALSPIVELVFGYTSRFRLMELMNLEQPLLREMMVTVPGTYHHSLIVANMVEAGARAVGANAMLCKVAALYHDIGKLKNPQYFIENQFGSKNKHDKLAPSMSALILISHVKKGAELARQHKLGQEISDIIKQHHGASLISYFYNKALQQAGVKADETVCEDDYRYPGPKPQTREAGIVMLADGIEASSRTLQDPTPVRLRVHIQEMTKRIFVAGQLDESDLTMKDLNTLGSAFHSILTGIFHQRIEYPGQKEHPVRPAAKSQQGNGCGAEPPQADASGPSDEQAAAQQQPAGAFSASPLVAKQGESASSADKEQQPHISRGREPLQ
jgi:putative nucleotidyltransferase with HDIG domain